MVYRIDFNTTDDPEIEEFQEAFRTCLAAATRKKNKAEAPWLSTPVDKTLPQGNLPKPWFESHYESTHIGPRRLEAVVGRLKKYEKDEGVRLYVVTNADESYQVTKSSKLICTIGLEGRVEPSGGDNGREVVERNKKEYVADDDGILTRRFAYCVRPKSKTSNAPETKDIGQIFPGWEYTNTNLDTEEQEAWALAMQQATAAAKQDRATWHQLTPRAKVCLGYLNYAKNGQFGICLSSTPKRIRDNAGVSFAKGVGHSIWRVDLSKIPLNVVLINLYARDPQEESWTATNPYAKKPKPKTGVWIAQGTVKNRELFCSEIPEAAAKEFLITQEMLEPNNWSWKKGKGETWFCDDGSVRSS